MADEWLTVTALSRLLHVSEHTIRYWLRRGLLPGAGKLPSGEWRIPAEALQAIVRKPKAQAAA